MTVATESNEVIWDQRGFASFQSKDFEQAADCYREVLRINSNSAVASSNLGYTYLARQQYPAAEKLFAKALLISPTLPAAQEGLCITYGSWEDKGQQTLDACGKALELNNGSSVANYFLGLEYLRRGQNERALDLLERARNLEPGTARHYIALGTAQVKLKKLGDALRSFGRAKALEPGLASAYFGEGTVYFLMRKRAQAIRSFRRAIEIDPDLEVAHFNLGITCLAEQQRDCALQQYNSLKMMDSSMAQSLFSEMFRERVLDVRAGH